MAASPILTDLTRQVIGDSGLSLAEVARRAGCARTTLSNIMWADFGPSEDLAARVLSACGYRLVITAEPIRAEVAA